MKTIFYPLNNILIAFYIIFENISAFFHIYIRHHIISNPMSKIFDCPHVEC